MLAWKEFIGTDSGQYTIGKLLEGPKAHETLECTLTDKSTATLAARLSSRRNAEALVLFAQQAVDPIRSGGV